MFIAVYATPTTGINLIVTTDVGASVISAVYDTFLIEIDDLLRAYGPEIEGFYVMGPESYAQKIVAELEANYPNLSVIPVFD